MSEICYMSMTELAEALQKRELGAREVVDACYERIEQTEDKIDALLALNKEEALKLADKMDSQGPDPEKKLWGVPVTVKDALSTKGLRTTAASRILANFTPFYDAFAVRRLKEAGAVILAKNNMDEFAMGSSTENSAFKKTRNPWNTARVPGGSSGGSAASVSSGQCFLSLGSDTGGSIRQPAAFCGCVGLKPTYGRVSRYGLFAFASSLDQIGPIARSAADCALALQVIAGHDPRDNTSENLPVPDYLQNLKNAENSLNGKKIGVPAGFFGEGLSGETRRRCEDALKKAVDLGAELVEIELIDPRIATAAYYIIAMAEASSNLARYDGVRYGERAPGADTLDKLYEESRSLGFGREVKRRIMLGSYVLSSGYYDAYFRKAAQTRALIRKSYMDALAKCDAIAMPVAPVTAWELGAHEANPLEAYLMDAFTLPVNLAGLPAISIPVGLGGESGMPVGLQLIGRPFAEAPLLQMAAGLETALPPLGRPDLSARPARV